MCLRVKGTYEQVPVLDLPVKRQILRYQSPTTGLFPDHSKEKKVGSVRSTIYCSMAVWSLQQAYK